MRISLLQSTFAVCQLGSETPLPSWASQGEFLSVTRTAEELSIVCDRDSVPHEVRAERDWRALMLAGPLDFAMVGVLAKLSTTLAAAGVSIFAISTYNTDYILIKEDDLETAISALKEAGHQIVLS